MHVVLVFLLVTPESLDRKRIAPGTTVFSVFQSARARTGGVGLRAAVFFIGRLAQEVGEFQRRVVSANQEVH